MSDLFQKEYFKKYLYIVLGIIFIFYILANVGLDKNKISDIFKNLNYFNISIAILLYLLSHTVRVLRLIILNPLTNYSIRGLWREQYKANGVNILLPFKLGEAYRLIYFRSYFGSYFNSFVVLLCERFLDLLTIFIILSISIYLSPLELSALNYVLFGSLILLLSMAIIYYSLEELTFIVHKIFIERKTTSLNVHIVNSTGNLLSAIKKIKEILNQKYASCMAISLLIWALEISAFFIFFEILGGKIDVIIFLALAVSLSSLLPNGPMGFGGIQLAFYSIGIAINNPDIVNYSIIYSVFIFGSGLLISGILFIYDYFKINKNA
jgi:uncharacterized membrane protein YbhN (UPF0104 family)